MFTSKSLAFLRALKRNNKRDWFHARKDQFEEHLRQPMIEIIERLAVDFRAFAPDMVADPKVSLFRQWRDTRFSHDKTPLKTNIGSTYPNRVLGRMNGAGFHFEVGPTWTWIGGGLWAPDTSQLQLVREHIAANYKTFDKIVTSPSFRKIGGLKGGTVSRVPRGFDKNHKAAEYLVHKQFLGYREESAEFAISPALYKNLRDTLKTIAPLVQFLNEPLIAAGHVSRKAHILDE
jgi:uncharacterized protein (TIGR02453 family)